MRQYRAYILTQDDHIQTVRIIEAETDEQALEAAKQYVNGCDVELWDRSKKIARLSNKPTA